MEKPVPPTFFGTGLNKKSDKCNGVSFTYRNVHGSIYCCYEMCHCFPRNDTKFKKIYKVYFVCFPPFEN